MIRDFVRDRARVMPTDSAHEDVTAVRIWHCSYSTLMPLAGYPNVRTLVVGTFPDADLSPLAALKQLEYLSLLHLPRVTDLSGLDSLPRLRTVRLATAPGWDSSGKVTEVRDLRTLAALPNLQAVELFGVRPRDRSLIELESCATLQSVRVSKFPNAEVRRFREATGLSDSFAPTPGVADWR